VRADRDRQAETGDAAARLAAADYIADMSGSLALIARTHGLETLGYVLEMARLEAQSAADDPRSG
jgi:hypothetical protein